MVISNLYRVFWKTKTFVLDKLELEEQAVFLNNSLYLSDAAFTFCIILFLAKALPYLFTKALVKKKVSTHELISSMASVVILVEIPYFWNQLIFIRFLLFSVDLITFGPQQLVKDLTIAEVPEYSVTKTVYPIYLDKIQEHPGIKSK